MDSGNETEISREISLCNRWLVGERKKWNDEVVWKKRDGRRWMEKTDEKMSTTLAFLSRAAVTPTAAAGPLIWDVWSTFDQPLTPFQPTCTAVPVCVPVSVLTQGERNKDYNSVEEGIDGESLKEKKERLSRAVADGRRDNQRQRERTVSEIVCISAAGQPDGSLHREPYILIRSPAAAQNLHQQNHKQNVGGSHMYNGSQFAGSGSASKRAKTGINLKITRCQP